jgi:type IV pilus assembly protein PilY1
MNAKLIAVALSLSAAGLLPLAATAQVTENFTSTSTTNPWTFVNGACLTAGTSATSTAANPACVALPYYSGTPGYPTPEFGGATGVLPDANYNGALRFTDWFAQTGAILSTQPFPLSGGLQVTFTTVTYEGNSGGAAHDGADGMSFFLQDFSYPADVGAFGGSLGYTCSNVNFNGTLRASGIPRGYDGLAGGFVALGIDEYGNFLNGVTNTLGELNAAGTLNAASGDNTATGGGYKPMRIGMRGPGNTTWASLNTNPLSSAYYPTTLTNAQGAAAVQNTCRTGYLWDYSNPASPVETAIAWPDYGAIGGAYSVLPAGHPLANETATTRGQGVPISYNLSITPAGLLSLSYSYNGGALQNVITAQDITQGGLYPLPTAGVRFGFAGSTGGSRNIHEIMCFQAVPQNTSQSSAGLNQKQTAKVQTGTQVYFAKYNPITLAGNLTSQYLLGAGNTLSISSTINWDGSCVLTGVAAGAYCDSNTNAPPGPILAENNLQRVVFTWNGTAGVPFEYANLSTTWPMAGATEQALLDSGDGTVWPLPPQPYSRLDYLRGDRSNEQTPSASSSATYQGVFRDRASVLGDIIDSSPTWVGPPQSPYPNVWADKFPPAAAADPMPENAGPTYGTFAGVSGMLTRTNVVYAGANDGMLHGFRSGYFSAPNTYQPANNDGYEVMAYVPGYVVNSIQNAVFEPANYSDPQYGHHYDVDAPPGTGDLFYQGAWHTWLVGGLGPGGSAIYALDITNPGLAGATDFSENGTPPGTPGTTVIGEWATQTFTITTPAGPSTSTVTNLNCSNVANCSTSLGKTFGVPQIRRFHNGQWGAVFGNGQGSSTGDGGIYVMLVDPVAGPANITFYYLSTSTGSPATPNGIDYTTPADLDGDHISDYVYAGDLYGNVWRFDLTSNNPSNWGVTNAGGVSINALTGGGGTATPLFTTPAGQPITTQVSVAAVAGTANPRVLVEFGTGMETAFTNFEGASFQTSQQALYGVWDWNLTAWNAASIVQYASLPGGGIPAPMTPLSGTGNLVAQSILSTYSASAVGTVYDDRVLSSLPVCYADSAGCSEYGWFLNLVSGSANNTDPALPTAGGNPQYPNAPVVYEQVIFNPTLQDGAFVVNTTIPPASAPTMCFSAAESGWTMAVNPATGGAFTNSFFGTPQDTFLNVTTTDTSGNTTTSVVSGVAMSGTGSTTIAVQGTQSYLLTQNVPGTGALIAINPPGGTIGSRLTWIERR